MLADQFTAAVVGARTLADLDNVSRLLWRAHGEGHVADADADAEAVSAAVEARRARIKGMNHGGYGYHPGYGYHLGYGYHGGAVVVRPGYY